MVILLVYVDDIIITGSDSGLINKLQQVLHATFHMKDLGQLTYFLGLEVHHRPNAGLEDTSLVATPMEVKVKYREDEGALLDDPTIYRQMVGGLIYLTTTRPDISYSVHQRIRDADWARCLNTRRSTTGWCMFLGDAMISSKFKNQDRMSKSSTKVEYLAMSTACSEVIWLCDLLAELQFSQTSPTLIHADNTSAI
ncbi:uncharacterized mitochondrial protein AtMg00810-like [Aristolochia californica]|uniref:uncharacterized mitochondrial protein AtMg00810-like n=1 Tax=Aristolochia californica TaxID=171875 RepID=UPI0035E29834